jgi:DNA-binding LacI/PurR family transcriptional regulator
MKEIRDGIRGVNQRLPSEKDLAVEYGVSVGTVVRALDDLVRQGVVTRRRGAGTFVNGEPCALTNIIFIYEQSTDISSHTYFGPIFDGLCQICFQNDINLGIATAASGEWSSLPERFPNSAFFFASPTIGSRPALTGLWHQKHCFVVVGASWEEPVPFPTVDSDNFNGARRAVEYLLRLGHRRIALVNGEDESANCRDRRRGYEAALRSWKLPSEPELIVSAGASMEFTGAARNSVIDLFLASNPPTALLCAGFYLALEVMDVARGLDVTIPDQLSIIAFDDPKSAQYLQPPLATLRQPLTELGLRGATRLLQIMRSGEPDFPLEDQLPVDLILRASCSHPG